MYLEALDHDGSGAELTDDDVGLVLHVRSINYADRTRIKSLLFLFAKLQVELLPQGGHRVFQTHVLDHHLLHDLGPVVLLQPPHLDKVLLDILHPLALIEIGVVLGEFSSEGHDGAALLFDDLVLLVDRMRYLIEVDLERLVLHLTSDRATSISSR